MNCPDRASQVLLAWEKERKGIKFCEKNSFLFIHFTDQSGLEPFKNVINTNVTQQLDSVIWNQTVFFSNLKLVLYRLFASFEKQTQVQLFKCLARYQAHCSMGKLRSYLLRQLRLIFVWQCNWSIPRRNLGNETTNQLGHVCELRHSLLSFDMLELIFFLAAKKSHTSAARVLSVISAGTICLRLCHCTV